MNPGIRFRSNNPSTRVLSLLVSFYVALERSLKFKVWILLAVMIFCGIAEILSIASVFPFLSILSGNYSLENSPFSRLFNYFQYYFPFSQYLLLVAILFVILSLMSFSARLVSLWLTNKLIVSISLSLSKRVLSNILCRPFSFHQRENSSYLISIVSEYTSSCVQALAACLQLASSLLISISIIISLLWIDSTITIVLLTSFALYYFAISSFIFRKMRHNGYVVTQMSALSLKTLQEIFGSIRDIIIGGTVSFSVNIFLGSEQKYRQAQSSSTFLSLLPRYSLEFLGFLSIAAVGIWLRFSSADSSPAPIALLGTIAVAFQRLLPAFQQVFSGLATINGSYPALKTTSDYICNPLKNAFTHENGFHRLDTALEFQDVCFSYCSSGQYVLKNVNLVIESGERVGIIGASGSGKSTFLDLLMGLHKPSSGKLLFNGKDVYGPDSQILLKSLYASISHVPQSIYLIDASIAENIAFGIERHLIDFEKLALIANCVCLENLIDTLPDKWNTVVGERAAFLSGGQIQRIGIARALYRDPDVLIIDEATSGLDRDTESAVLTRIYAAFPLLTIVIVAHNMRSLIGLDRIFKVENGQVNACDLV